MHPISADGHWEAKHWDEKPGSKAFRRGANDRQWLESMIHNSAPFTDAWTKARIVQLSYGYSRDRVTYPGLTSAEAIAQALQALCDPAEYPFFSQTVTPQYVIDTLTDWQNKRFSQAVSRNFEIYAHRTHPNVFLVTSTANISLNVRRVLPPAVFRPLFNVDELAPLMRQRLVRRLTLRVHGYSNPAASFYRNFALEADELCKVEADTHLRALPDDHFYMGYHWPSEKPVTSPGLWLDFQNNLGIVFKFLFVLSGLAGIFGTLLYWFLRYLWVPFLGLFSQIPGLAGGFAWANFAETVALSVQWYWIVPTVFLLWVMAFLLLRVVVYQRDRYRAIHYGAPDLAEFFWRLDRAFSRDDRRNSTPRQNSSTLSVNFIGHSMGALLLVNTLRILSDRFGKDDTGTLMPDFLPSGLPGETLVSVQEMGAESPAEAADDIGQYFRLDKLILASPDIPLEFLREGRNNYVRSAMRRCRRIYLFSSDRDIVLRYLSTLGNWFTEPSIQMSGLRLGNVYLKKMRPAQDSADPVQAVYYPFVRIMIHSEAAVQERSAYDLFRKFNYLDCSEMGSEQGIGGVNGVGWPLNPLTALPIDILNTFLFLLGIGRLDLHGGYFRTNTRSFQILKFLLTANFLADTVIKTEIETLTQGTPIRFLPSQAWSMPRQ